MATREGWTGWDEYAPFYDWENTQTLGRRDVAFWKRLVSTIEGPVLELGCGTGRISAPLARAGAHVVGIDRSAPMLERAHKRARTLSRREPRPGGQLQLVRGDIRLLPFPSASFNMVAAPYGILQSLVRERDLAATLDSVARVTALGGLFGVDLVPDVPGWREYTDRVQMRGKAAGGAHLTLVESVRQDARRKLTIFEQRFIVRRGGRRSEHPFQLTFRTLPIKGMTRRIERAGFAIEAVLGDYRGRPWDTRADVWLILARRV